MAKEFHIFFSWQADLPSKETKSFINSVLKSAKKELAPDISLYVDEATRNELGSPDIVQTIFEKIEQADLFIADVSIVGSYEVQKQAEEENEDGEEDEPKVKYVPNSNVMLELGYAAGTISWERMICFANTKFGEIDDLPFDLNHRRVTGYSFEEQKVKRKYERIYQR